MIKRGIFVGLLALALAGCNWIGNGYSHVVDRPQADVVAALEDLDISTQPGNPGTDPSVSGGVKPDIRLEKAADHMTWWVMAGDKVATTMTATFEPLDGGKRTRVTTSVAARRRARRRVSPAFRSTGITSGLFSMAVEGELNKMTAPPARQRRRRARADGSGVRRRKPAEPDLQDRPRRPGPGDRLKAQAIAQLRQMADAAARARLPDGRQRRVQAGVERDEAGRRRQPDRLSDAARNRSPTRRATASRTIDRNAPRRMTMVTNCWLWLVRPRAPPS